MPSHDPQFRQVQHVVVTSDQTGQRIDNYLMGVLKTVPRSLVYRLLRTGQVRVNKKRIKPGYKLHAGDDVRIPPVTVNADDTEMHLPVSLIKQMEQAVIAEDRHWIVVDKPAGLAVHGGTGIKFGAIDLLQRIFDEAAISLVHRLDRDTSGCLVLARNRPAAVHFQAALRAGRVRKRYSTLLAGEFAEPVVVEAPLLKTQPDAGERMVVVDEKYGKASRSRFAPVMPGHDCSLVSVEIDTGRTHQIRVHAAYRGHSVVGDTRYGDRRLNARAKKLGHKRMFLHAAEIAFPALDNKQLENGLLDSGPSSNSVDDQAGGVLEFSVPIDERWHAAQSALNS